MPVQDDSREQQMVALFNLTVPPARGRSDVDAYLRLPGVNPSLPFELKSTSRDSVSTVRDFGPEHIAKWSVLHWLFAFYETDGTTLRYCYYASPSDMRDWIKEKERYIRPDIILAQEASSLIDDEILTVVLGSADSFDSSDARLVMKNQWKASDYRNNADLNGGRYSRRRMVGLLQDRLAYVIRRGATLNNPHIAERYFTDRQLSKIEEDHAATLRILVRDYLASGSPATALDPVVADQANASETDPATA